MPKNNRSVPLERMLTGKKRTNATKAASASGVYGNRSRDDRARRNPIPMPKKLPSSTKFEKYDR